ncbi:TlpA family protein disulfide reductase [Flavobacteriaceae bacterium]|nr:TlpA family protein disulfide reductase [Flavobacteriaceae bacterium]MDB9899557.1 TlpA family protein disulfide reductase [Flavobacteriaceae bacterium]
MKFSKIIMFALVFSVTTTTYLNAQNKKASQTVQYDFLKGLTKANEDDMSDQQIMLDGESIPVYSAEGKRVRGMEMMMLMTSSAISPDFSAKDMNGKTYSLSSLKGKVVVINFWFVECKPCVIEMPELNEIVQKYKSEKVVFLAFALNEQPKIESFLKKHAFDYTILPDSGAVIGDYKIKSYPAHIILDQNSKIAFSTRGLSNSTASEIDEAIEGLIEK